MSSDIGLRQQIAVAASEQQVHDLLNRVHKFKLASSKTIRHCETTAERRLKELQAKKTKKK